MNHLQVGVGVLIINEKNQILLGHRVSTEDTGGIFEPNTWTLPGGKMDYNETIYECAIREVKEETNLDIRDLEVYSANDDIAPDRHFVTLEMTAGILDGQVKVMEPNKIDEWRWFDMDNLPDNLYSPSMKFIDKYMEGQR
jgi:8-oxo-dGTP diphosphatase